MAATFHEGLVTLRPESQFEKKTIRPRDEVIMMNNDETYDGIMMKLG